MEHVRQRRLVWPSTSNLDTIFSIRGSSVFETVSNEAEWMVAFLNNEETDYLLVSIDDEVASCLERFFFMADEFCGGQILEMAAIGLDQSCRRK